jgi:hypothetical protein
MGPGHDDLLFTICRLPTAIDHHITTSRQYSRGGRNFPEKDLRLTNFAGGGAKKILK